MGGVEIHEAVQLKGRARNLKRDKEKFLVHPGRKPEDRLIEERDLWLDQYPELRRAYDAKEKLYTIYHTRDRAEAARRFDAWAEDLAEEARPAFKKVLGQFTDWRQEILNAWNRLFGRPSNARTEAANGVLKLRKRIGRGYGFAAFRALAIYGVARLAERPHFGEGWEKYAPIRKARPRKEKPKRKRARDRNPYQFPEMDWQAEVKRDEALRPKPPEAQISIGL